MKDGEFCPLIKKKCVGHKCAWYTQVQGFNPQTGQEVNDYKCAVAWMPMMAVENSQMSRQTTAAVESFRNETVAANDRNNKLYTHALNQGIVQAQITPHPPINTLPPNQG